MEGLSLEFEAHHPNQRPGIPVLARGRRSQHWQQGAIQAREFGAGLLLIIMMQTATNIH